MAKAVLGYVDRPGFLHRLTGTAKLILVGALVLAAMLTFDARLLLALSALSMVLWAVSRIKLSDLKVVLLIILTFMLLNNLLIFVFAPRYGVSLFGTEHIIVAGPGRWVLTWEQLFYQALVTLKYFAVLPGVLLFIATTPPPEFAASLNSLGVPYRFAYSVSLALRYIPDVQRDYETISIAQQARGLDASRKAPLGERAKNLLAVLMPLLFGSLDRIETTSAAMELRGFGSRKKRTWWSARPLRLGDWLIILASIAIVGVAIWLQYVNGGRFWNPFV
ncbi:energy-coupling factor transporter transmembrane component T family protein [Arcanobacterium phocisimile]|uniref:energy-coupling factor transporter transmembrane component T family protein n=1 Tax=Arcanobacterium phocisimile TaxID=1302235 RepID=UPI001EF88E0E|nr:energy-coupling factor transporter transmembrane component T [Arcanobacterium phocisimile]